MRPIRLMPALLIVVLLASACYPPMLTPGPAPLPTEAAPETAPTATPQAAPTAEPTAPAPTVPPPATPAPPTATVAPATVAPVELPTVAVPAEVLDLIDAAALDARAQVLLALLEATGLTETLRGQGPFTLFAPSDQALATLPAGTLEELGRDPARLRETLLYHVAPAKLMAADIVKLTSVSTAMGKPITVRVSGGALMLNDATVVAADIAAPNGVIHIIDRLLAPPAQ